MYCKGKLIILVSFAMASRIRNCYYLFITVLGLVKVITLLTFPTPYMFVFAFSNGQERSFCRKYDNNQVHLCFCSLDSCNVSIMLNKS